MQVKWIELKMVGRVFGWDERWREEAGERSGKVGWRQDKGTI